MAIKYFCDLGGEEIPEGDTYFTVTVTANTTGDSRRYEQERDNRYSVGSAWHDITRVASMVCRTCTIDIARKMDEPRG